jgi:hypothetical protein
MVACMRLLLGLMFFVAACGAHSDLVTPAPTQRDGGTEKRACLPNCSVGHQCCLGGCNGPAVVTENDCCTCLEGEISSGECGGTCGG